MLWSKRNKHLKRLRKQVLKFKQKKSLSQGRVLLKVNHQKANHLKVLKVKRRRSLENHHQAVVQANLKRIMKTHSKILTMKF